MTAKLPPHVHSPSSAYLQGSQAAREKARPHSTHGSRAWQGDFGKATRRQLSPLGCVPVLDSPRLLLAAGLQQVPYWTWRCLGLELRMAEQEDRILGNGMSPLDQHNTPCCQHPDFLDAGETQMSFRFKPPHQTLVAISRLVIGATLGSSLPLLR